MIRLVLGDTGDATTVVVRTTLNVTGKPAQFGRGVVQEITARMVRQFAANLAAAVTAGEVPRQGRPDRTETAGAAKT